MSKAEYNSFGRKLAFHTAPTLLGIKCASLFSLSSSEFDLAFHSQYFNRRTAALGLASRILCSCKNRSLILVYSREQLAKRLADRSAKAILERYGYTSDMTVDECLDRLSERIGGVKAFLTRSAFFLAIPLKMLSALSRTREKISSSAVLGRFTEVSRMLSVHLRITIGAEIFCAIN